MPLIDLPVLEWIPSRVQFPLCYTYRVADLMMNQVRALRTRQFVDSFVSGARKGAYWRTYADIADYEVPDALPCPPDQTMELAHVPIRIARLRETVQERLINWGYAVCDAAMRRYVDDQLCAPKEFPYPDARVGC